MFADSLKPYFRRLSSPLYINKLLTTRYTVLGMPCQHCPCTGLLEGQEEKAAGHAHAPKQRELSCWVSPASPERALAIIPATPKERIIPVFTAGKKKEALCSYPGLTRKVEEVTATTTPSRGWDKTMKAPMLWHSYSPGLPSFSPGPTSNLFTG